MVLNHHLPIFRVNYNLPKVPQKCNKFGLSKSSLNISKVKGGVRPVLEETQNKGVFSPDDHLVNHSAVHRRAMDTPGLLGIPAGISKYYKSRETTFSLY